MLIVKLLVLLSILPYYYGRILLSNIKKTRLLNIPVGFMIELVIWAVISLPIVYSGGNLSMAVIIYEFANIPCGIYAIKSIFVYLKKSKRGALKKENIEKTSLNIIFVIMICCVLFQVTRVTVFQTQEYRDSKTYNAIVNDTVETDKFFSIVDTTGAIQWNALTVSKKYILSSWYTFEAMLSKSSGLHPLILNNTVLPGYLIILFYIVSWNMISIFISDNRKKCLFIIILSLLYELEADDISNILLSWPTWGKNITATITVPIIIILWDLYIKNRLAKNVFSIILMVAAGCTASNMGFMIMPIEISFLVVIEMFLNRKIDWKMVGQYVLMLVPALIYAFLFVR